MTTKTQHSPEELIQLLANAYVTHGGALGRGKAERNRENFESYRRALIARKIPIPADVELARIGVFNGPGSS